MEQVAAGRTDGTAEEGATQPRAGDVKKMSIEQQKQMLNSIYAAMWGFKLCVAGLIICILGLHGACCLFPNYKTSDAVCYCVSIHCLTLFRGGMHVSILLPPKLRSAHAQEDGTP